MAIWQFVADMATPNPAVRLDLNVAPIMVADGYTLDPPPFDKGYADSTLRHGATPTNSVARNRVLSIPLQLLSTGGAVAGVIESIGRQIMTDNILKVQFGASPVFFRTFADPDQSFEVKKTLVEQSKVTLQLEAEPFAYGPRVEVAGSPFVVANDPAAGLNPCQFDITGVLGDVPTPVLLLATSTGAAGAPSGLVNKWSHFATRRRGTPGGYSNVVQGEAMALDIADTTVTAPDATMSGGSKIRTTFAIAATLSLRAHDTFPANGVSTVEARGEYVVYGRFAKTIAADVINVQLRYGTGATGAVANDVVTLPAVAGPMMVNLGKVPVPAFSDPIQHGYSGVPMKALMAWVGYYAQRVSGTGFLDLDYLYFVPADESTLIVKFPATDTTYALDGTTREGGSVYAAPLTLDEVLTIVAAPQITGGGGFPELIPGQTNRIHFLRQVDLAGTSDAVTDTTTIRGYYWPRWREFTRS